MPKLNLQLLEQMIEEGYVVSQRHPIFPLHIYNYTRKATYEKMWNEITLQCRGLILDEQMNVVSLPIKKFFNWDEHPEEWKNEMLKQSYTISNKADGSCGILFEYQGTYGIATRGSFMSEQAIWATEFLNEEYKDVLKFLPTDEWTFVFEIIYPQNRIVCSYDYEELILLAVINKETGKELDLSSSRTCFSVIPILSAFLIVEHYPELKTKTFKELQEMNIPNKEGFVIRFEDGTRVKLKFAEYCRLHSVITNFCARDIWAALKDGRDLDEVLVDVPDEFDKWVRYRIAQFREDFRNLGETLTKAHLKVLSELPNREANPWIDEATYKKMFALKNLELNKKNGYSGFIFALEKGQDITEKIWEWLYPPHEKPTNIEENE